MKKQFNINKSLQELENCDWGEPDYDSYLVTTCHKLRRIPLKEFKIEDLRIMIAQNISLKFLMPLALEQLRNNPLAEGDFYPGDLLIAVLRTKAEFWNQCAQYIDEIHQIVQSALLVGDDDSIEYIKEAYQLFPKNN
ncbi:MAG: contact-dependent growth inhibition system immunity protein [Rhabdochlamydiaceae bacterium]|jgi:hypothetical protein